MTPVRFTLSFSHEDFWADVTEAREATMAALIEILPHHYAVDDADASAGRDQVVVLADLVEGHEDVAEQEDYLLWMIRRAKETAGWRRVNVGISRSGDPFGTGPQLGDIRMVDVRPASTIAPDDAPQEPGVAIDVVEDDEYDQDAHGEFLIGTVSVTWRPAGSDGVQQGPQSVAMAEALHWARAKAELVHVRIGMQHFNAGPARADWDDGPQWADGTVLRRRRYYEPPGRDVVRAWWVQATFHDTGLTSEEIVRHLERQPSVERVLTVDPAEVSRDDDDPEDDPSVVDVIVRCLIRSDDAQPVDLVAGSPLDIAAPPDGDLCPGAGTLILGPDDGTGIPPSPPGDDEQHSWS